MNRLFYTGFLLALSLLFTDSLQAQAKGNAKRSKGNYNYYDAPQQVNSPLPQAQIQNGQLIIDVRALSNQEADRYVAIFSLTQLGKTAKEASQLLQTRRQQFTQSLSKLGIAEEAVFTDIISFVPLYEYEVENKVFSKSYQEVPSGFEIKQNMHIAFDKESLLPDLVFAAAEEEIYDLVKVDYFVNDSKQVYTELRQSAIAYAKSMLEDYEVLGVEMDTVYRVLAEQRGRIYPSERYSSYQAFGSSAVSGKGKVEKVRKNTTTYYDKLPYNNFDIVINPVLLKPAVQFHYHLKLQFQLPPAKTPVRTETQREFMLLTPDGNLKRLKIE